MSTALEAPIKNASYIIYVHFSLSLSLTDDFVEIQYPVVEESCLDSDAA